MVAFVWIAWKILVLVLQFVRYVSEKVFRWIHKRDVQTILPLITDDILLQSAVSIASKIRSQEVTSEQVVRAFMKRIEQVNPIINCVVENRFDEALKEAKKVDHFIQESDKKFLSILEHEKPFFGVPFTIKEMFSAKGMHWTSGLVARKDNLGTFDSDVIRLMKEAGAILLATTNIPELGMWWESHNHVYGRSNNPYDVTRTVGGSSGGEGGILSAGGSPCGIGSDVGGSVRIPAFFCGIFAHKPSPGIVSNYGQIPLMDPKFLVTGPMSRFCSDLLPMYRVLASKNVDKLQLDSKVSLSKLRFFFIEDFGANLLLSPVHPDLKNAMNQVVHYIRETYDVPVKKVDLYEFSRASEMWYCKIKSIDAGPSFSRLMGDLKTDVPLFRELFKSCFGLSDHTLAAIMHGLSDKYIVPNVDDPASVSMVNLLDRLHCQLRDLLGDDGILLVPPSTACAPHHHQPLTKQLDFAYTGIFNVLGLPVTQVPLGLGSLGLPLGVQVVANAYQDHLTLAVATELEKSFGGWICPS